ncbi:MAG: hypothetical protein H7256_08630 [Bdellovibrio sp.]|nr:hypothetical protein [Bdellovibrio sp.]
MIPNFKEIRKTAAQTAVFYFAATALILSYSVDCFSKANSGETSFEAVKAKVIKNLIQKQKKQALLAIDEFMALEKNKQTLKEARDFKVGVAKKFLTKEAQEFYEVSLNSTLDNVKDAKKNNDECLSLEPENLDCQIQKVRLIYRDNPNKFNDKVEIEKVNKFFADPDFNWVKVSAEKNKPDFKNLSFYKKESGILTEDKLIKAILELDRTFAAKNFTKSKEILQAIEKDFKDWPDLVFFKQNIDIQTIQESSINASETTNLYQMKCKNLSKTISRKYRYDFDLCARGNL